MIDTSTAPYFDDFQESKNYLKVLFKPGYAVQSRELNQLQTSLQNQISKMGDHVFKDGSVVLGGFSNYYDASYIDLEGVGDVNDLLDTVITGSGVGGSGARGKVTFVLSVNNVYRVYYGLISKNRFIAGETVTTINMAQFTVVNSADFSGTARLFSIGESVFYTKGHYVFCEKQIIQVNSSNAHIGLVIKESIVDSYNDFTLLDPAQGTYNYAAPGADRYHISLTLTAFDVSVDAPEDLKFGEFIEIARISNSHIVKRISKASYSDLEVNMARRTYDESGDYTVRPFAIKINPDINGDSAKLTVSVDPGKAYIKGYEFETLGITNISINKAREVSDVVNTVMGVNFGTFLYILPFSGFVDYERHQTVNFYGAVDGTGVSIGTANIDSISYHSSGPLVLKLSLINVQLHKSSTFADVKSLKSGSAVANISLSSYPNNIVNIQTNIDKPFILQTPHSYIKTLLTRPASPNYVSDTDILCYKKLSATVLNDFASLTLSGNESFTGNTTTDFLTVTGDGSIVFPISVAPINNTVKNLTFSGVSGLVAVYVKIALSATQHRTKGLVTSIYESERSPNNKGVLENVLVRDTANVLSREKIYLGVADCYKLDKIIAKSSKENSPVVPLDVTNYFNFNNGQKDDLYDFGWVQIKNGFDIPAAFDTLDIMFSYFEHMTYNGFFSVDSYTDLAYEDIPSYTSSKGIVYNLHSCLDFRPIRAADGTITSSYGVVLDSTVSAEYNYYLARIDKLVLTKERKLTVVKGVPAVTPKAPSDLIDAMSLYTIYIPPYTASHKDVNFEYNDNRRFTMRDIGKIEKRVGRLEYYTTLSYLEKQANDETIASELPGINRFKNGILVDSFAGHSVGNPGNPDYKCSIDKLNRTLRPRFSSYSYLYDVNTLTTQLTKENDLVHLSYSKSLLIENPYATKIVNANPYLIFNWNGLVTLNPATDNWVETKLRPDVIVNMNGENDVYTILNQSSDNTNSSGVLWNDWQSVVKGAVTGIEDEYDIVNSSSSVTDPSSGSQTVTNSSAITNTRTTTTTDVDIQTGIELLKSETRVLTKDIGNKVVDSSLVPFVRSRIVDFSAKHLKPETELYALLDGIDITQYTTPAIKITVELPNSIPNLNNIKRITSGTASAIVISSNHNDIFIKYEASSTSLFQIGNTLTGYIENTTDLNNEWSSVNTVGVVEAMYFYERITTDDKGNVAGYFVIPDPNVTNNPKFRTGELMFRLSDSLSVDCYTAAEVKYVTQGLSQSTERTLIATRVASATVKPVTNIKKSDTTNQESIVIGDVVSTVVLPPPPLPPTLACGDTMFSDGRSGVWEYFIDYGNVHPEVGESPQFVGIKINNTNGVPVKYTLTFEGREYTTGFIGFDDIKPIGIDTSIHSITKSESVDLFVTGNPVEVLHKDSLSYNDRLTNIGLPPIVNNTVDRLQFLKTTRTAKAVLKIEAPFEGADWGIESFCFPLPEPIPSYAISPDLLVVSEGDKVTFTVVTTNVAAGTILYWNLDTNDPLTTASSADFEQSFGTITVNAAGVSIFSMNVVDDLSPLGEEGLERFSVVLQRNISSDPVAYSSTITILDTSVTLPPTYKITPEAQFVLEGDRILFTVTTTNVPNETELLWEVDTVFSNTESIDFSADSGSIIVNNGVAVFSIQVVTDALLAEGEYFRVNLKTDSTTVVDVSASITIIESSEAPTYSITPNVKQVNEGGTVDFDVVTTNVSGTPPLYWNITGSTAVAADFNPAESQGDFVLAANGTYTLSRVTIDEGLGVIDPDEKFLINLYTDSGRTVKVATSTLVEIVDRSKIPVPTYSIVPLVPPGLKVNEGAAIPYVVSTTNVPNGTVLYWRIFDGTTNAASPLPRNTVEPIDFEYGITGCYGSVTINNGNSGFGLQTIDDEEGEDPDEGNEIVTVYLYTDSGYTNLVATAATVTIIDPINPPANYDCKAKLNDIGLKNVGNRFLRDDWDTTISESINFGEPINASWSGTKNGVKLNSSVKYQLKSITVTELNVTGGYIPQTASRVLVFNGLQPETYYHKNKHMIKENYQSYRSIGPINEEDLGGSFSHPWLNPPTLITVGSNKSPINTIKGPDEPVPLFLVFNPHITMYSKHWVNFCYDGNCGDFGTQNITENPLHFKITTTWEYVSGAPDIDDVNKILIIEKSGAITATPGYSVTDPVAQTFFVDGNIYPNGVFIKNVEVFFKKKSSWAPIEVQIRPVVNGFPSAQSILPFGISVKTANEVNVSTDATVGTNFEFDNIIHLSPGEHSFVVLTNTDEYELYVSRLGEFSINDPDERITTQPLLGSLFMSQNATTWTPIQEEDVKFRIFKCDFITNEVGTALLNTHYPHAGNIDYEVFYSGGETVDFSDTTIEYAVKPTSMVSGSPVTNPTFIPYQVSTNINMGETKTLVGNDGSSLQLQVNMSTADGNVTPIIDMNRLSNVLVKNIINNDAEGETQDFGGNAYAKYITRAVKLNTGFESKDIKLYFNAKVPLSASLKVYYKVATPYDSIIDDNTYTEMLLAGSDTWIDGKYIEYSYKTPFTSAQIVSPVGIVSDVVTVDEVTTGLITNMTSTAILDVGKAIFATPGSVGDLGVGPDFECVVTKIINNTSIEFSINSGSGVLAGDILDIRLGASMVGAESRAFANGEAFDTFYIKIVMLSSNPAFIPIIKDLRVIALDD